MFIKVYVVKLKKVTKKGSKHANIIMKINIYQPLDNYKKALLSLNVLISLKLYGDLSKIKTYVSNTNTLTENVDLYYLNGLSLIEKGLLV